MGNTEWPHNPHPNPHALIETTDIFLMSYKVLHNPTHTLLFNDMVAQSHFHVEILDPALVTTGTQLVGKGILLTITATCITSSALVTSEPCWSSLPHQHRSRLSLQKFCKLWVPRGTPLSHAAALPHPQVSAWQQNSQYRTGPTGHPSGTQRHRSLWNTRYYAQVRPLTSALPVITVSLLYTTHGGFPATGSVSEPPFSPWHLSTGKVPKVKLLYQKKKSSTSLDIPLPSLAPSAFW